MYLSSIRALRRQKYSLLERIFQNIFQAGQAPFNRTADPAFAHALGGGNLGLALAEDIVLIDPPGLNGRELGQRVIEGKIALLLVHVLIRGHGAVEHVGLEAGIGVQGALTVSALLALVAVTQTAAADRAYYESPRPSSSAPGLWDKKSQSSGHRDQKQGRGHTKAPAQHDAMRTHEKLLHLIYWLISYS